jgi:3-phosphoshikimate 1-carboxyvinyltransferase
MEGFRIFPARRIEGEISVPGDKSISHRALMLGAISDGVTRVRNFLTSDDCMRTISAFRAMGIEIEEGEEVRIEGKGIRGLEEPSDVIDLGNSGTAMRLILGILSGQPFFSVLTGDSSLRRRPMGRVTKPLTEMGARISGRCGGEYPPISVVGGELRAIEHKVEVASAQVKSALLLAGLYAKGRTELHLPQVCRDHTERMMRWFGVDVRSDGLSISIEGPAQPKGSDVYVPGDISSAAFFIVAASVMDGSYLRIKDVGVNPTRTGILDALSMMGADIEIEGEREVCGEPVADIIVRGRGSLKGIKVCGDLIPRMIDEIPVLSVAAAMASGETEIRDAAELRKKESDRISSMAEELRKAGVHVEELGDGMVIRGEGRLLPSVFESHGDHRVAMAMAIASLLCDGGPSEVRDVGWISTSFPGFFELLEKVVVR